MEAVKLDFLDPGKKYVATLYLDGKNAHWERNPMVWQIRKGLVEQGSMLKLDLAAGGGAAVSLLPATAEEIRINPDDFLGRTRAQVEADLTALGQIGRAHV